MAGFYTNGRLCPYESSNQNQEVSPLMICPFAILAINYAVIFAIPCSFFAKTTIAHGQQDDRIDLKTILDAHESNLAQIESLKCEFEENSSTGKTTTAIWLKDGPREKFEMKASYIGRDGEVLSYQCYFVDYKNHVEKRLFIPEYRMLNRLTPANQYGSNAMVTLLGNYQVGFKPWYRLMLKFHAIGRDDVLTLRELLDESQNVKIAKIERGDLAGSFEITGVKKALIDNKNIDFKIVVDPGKGFLVRQVSWSRDKRIFLGNVTKFEQFKNGIYFPIEAEWKMTGKNGRANSSHRPIVCKVKKLTTNTRPTETVALQFPKYAVVRVFEKEPITGRGRFSSKPLIRVIGKNGKTLKEFKPNQIDEFKKYRQQFVDENSSDQNQISDFDGRFENQSNIVRRNISRMAAKIATVASAVVLVWILIRFIQITKKHRHETTKLSVSDDTAS
jgi:hypothetical protein